MHLGDIKTDETWAFHWLRPKDHSPSMSARCSRSQEVGTNPWKWTFTGTLSCEQHKMAKWVWWSEEFLEDGGRRWYEQGTALWLKKMREAEALLSWARLLGLCVVVSFSSPVRSCAGPSLPYTWTVAAAFTLHLF